jgi:starch synthase
MRILFATSEVMPFSKTGGLADVSAALPAALAKQGHEVTIITPRYKCVDPGTHELHRKRQRLTVSIRGKPVHGSLLEGKTPAGVPVLFVDQPGYFDRDGLYGTHNADYPDNDERYAFFSRCVLESCVQLDLSPDIIHCNDWQTGPVPVLLEEDYRDRPVLNGCGVVFTIHNLGYQGLFPPDALMSLGLGWEMFTPSSLEFYGKLNYMKAGLVFADRITTVSRRYAEEIQTPAFGFGLDGVLRERASDLRGILNGVDYRLWDPSHDPHIAAPYSREDLSGKAKCKADLQQRMGLPQNPGLPLIGIVSRLTSQKGLDLFIDSAEELIKLDAQWAFLGTGDGTIEQALIGINQRHPHRLSVHVGHNEELAHRIEAGADIFLMPSRYEPCGLNQIYSLRYGTLPVVHAVGGLYDTIDDVSEGEGNGFLFSKPTGALLLECMKRALATFRDRERWIQVMNTAMAQDFSWDPPSRRYQALYREVKALRS